MIDGLISAISPVSLLWTFVGTASGILVGAMPGLGGGMLMALALPLTFSMAPIDAILLLIGIHVGSVSGGLISATLLKMPGTPSSIMSTFDGHPMAVRGEPERALSLGIGSSLVGGLIAGVALVLLGRGRIECRIVKAHLWACMQRDDAVEDARRVGSAGGGALLDSTLLRTEA